MMISTVAAAREISISSNYENWKIQMKNLLMYNDVWNYVNGSNKKPRDIAKLAGWMAKDEYALGLIKLYLSREELKCIKRCNTSKYAWIKLGKMYRCDEPMNLMLEKFYNFEVSVVEVCFYKFSITINLIAYTRLRK